MELFMDSITIIKLGEKLVQELELNAHVDTLARWMAHYIAELIEQVKNTTGEEQEKYQKECADIILKLWNHIDRVPNIDTPLRSFSTISNMLEKITSDNPYKYFHEKYEDNDNVYLLLAQRVDSLAKNIVRLSLGLAIGEATEIEKEWLKFDMLEDVVNINKAYSYIENEIEVVNNEVDISQIEKEKLRQKIEEFNNILKLINF